MISIPGNKTITLAALICCMSLGLMLGAMLSQRQRSVNLYEKKLEKRISAINERNISEMNIENINALDGSKSE